MALPTPLVLGTNATIAVRTLVRDEIRPACPWRANETTLKEVIELLRPDVHPGATRHSAGRGRAFTTIGATPPSHKYALGLDLKYGRNRTRGVPRRVRAIAFDRPRHPFPLPEFAGRRHSAAKGQ